MTKPAGRRSSVSGDNFRQLSGNDNVSKQRTEFIPLFTCIAGLFLVAASTGCSLKKMAANQVGNALAGSGTTFASDNDPELVRDAIPFTLKLVESVLAETPDHKRLRTAAAAYFTQYAYGFIQLEADYIEAEDYEAAEAMRQRAKKLFLRGRNHGLQRLEQEILNFPDLLQTSPKEAVAQIDSDLTETLYWTAAAWGSAITLGKDDPYLIAEVPQMEALIDRALALDPDWNDGAIHSFLITYEMSRQLEGQDPETESRKHFEAALKASKGKQLSPYVSLAEAVCVQTQEAEEFQNLLNQALAISIDEYPEFQLVNLLMKKRAEWLLSQMDELFLLDEGFDFDE